MKIKYVEHKFSSESLRLISLAEAICEEYQGQGFSLTLRQLYYQFVARGHIANKDKEYKRLGSIINDARLAGLIDWSHIEDRTRFLRSNSHWGSPADIIEGAAQSYAIDKWAAQPLRCEVWIEKDALVGVIEGVCDEEDVPYFSCRGYASQSEVWGAAQRLGLYAKRGQGVLVLHLGDHDPSGIDMSRDIAARLALFTRGTLVETEAAGGIWTIDRVGGGRQRITVKRIALNMPQVEEFDPPPNPAKLTDSRCDGYIKRFGDESWELDALSPDVIAGLIRTEVTDNRDGGLWERKQKVEEEGRDLLAQASRRWDELSAQLKADSDEE